MKKYAGSAPLEVPPDPDYDNIDYPLEPPLRSRAALVGAIVLVIFLLVMTAIAHTIIVR